MKKRCFTCCIILLIILLLLGGVASFAVLYMPKPATIIEKLTSQGLTAVYVEAKEDGVMLGEEDLALPALAILGGYAAVYENITFTGVIMFMSKVEAEDPEIAGIILITDSIKSTADMLIDFYTDNKSEELQEEVHASMRGKAFFVGNVKAELEFRKIIF